MILPRGDQVVDIKGRLLSSEYIFPLGLRYIHLMESEKAEELLIGALDWGY